MANSFEENSNGNKVSWISQVLILLFVAWFVFPGVFAKLKALFSGLGISITVSRVSPDEVDQRVPIVPLLKQASSPVVESIAFKDIIVG